MKANVVQTQMNYLSMRRELGEPREYFVRSLHMTCLPHHGSLFGLDYAFISEYTLASVSPHLCDWLLLT